MKRVAKSASARRDRLKVEITNDSALKRVPRSAMKRAATVCATVHGVRHGNVSIILLRDRQIRTINKQFLRHDYATDVITFSMDEQTFDGEIYIGVETARRQAQEYDVSLTNEILRLVIHGVLHLVGFDDATTALRERMHREENNILQKL